MGFIDDLLDRSDRSETFRHFARRSDLVNVTQGVEALGVNVKNFGAKGDDVTDDTAAILAAAATIPHTGAGPRGGTLYFPRGSYVVQPDALNFADYWNLTLQGPVINVAGDTSPANGAAIIKCKSGAGSRIIDARSTQAFTMRGIAVVWTQPGFPGIGLDLAHSGSLSDSQHSDIAGCMFGCSDSAGANAGVTSLGVNLQNAIFAWLDNCYFGRANYGIRGRFDGGGGSIAYSNVMDISRCQFARVREAIVNIGDAWLIRSCGFEGTGGTMQHAYKSDIFSSPSVVEGGIWINNWHGDAFSAIPNYWYDYGISITRGLIMLGAFIAQKKAIKFGSNGGGRHVLIGGSFGDTAGDHLIDPNTSQIAGLIALGTDMSGIGAFYPILNRFTQQHYGFTILGMGSSQGPESVEGMRDMRPIGSPVPTTAPPTVSGGSYSFGGGAPSASFSAGSSDMSGTVNIHTGGGPGTDPMVVVQYSKPLSNTFSPGTFVTLTPANALTAALAPQAYAAFADRIGFNIHRAGGLAANSDYAWTYNASQG